MIRVDAHHHLWDTRRATYPWLTAELAAINRPFDIRDLRAAVVSAGIDATVLVQTRSSVEETVEFLGTPQPVAGVIGWADLTTPTIGDSIAALLDGVAGAQLVGIRHQVHDEADPNWLDRPDVRRGLEAVAAHGLPFDLLVRTREMPAATRLAASMPECRFVLDHLAKPPLSEPLDSEGMAVWETAIRALAMLPNVSAKICGLVTEADWNTWTTDVLRPVVDVALDAFGPNRLMFGSDWPVCLLAASYVSVSDTVRTLLAELSPSELDAVLGATAIEVYELDIERHARTNQT